MFKSEAEGGEWSRKEAVKLVSRGVSSGGGVGEWES